MNHDELIEKMAEAMYNKDVENTLNPSAFFTWRDYIKIAQAALSSLQDYMPEHPEDDLKHIINISGSEYIKVSGYRIGWQKLKNLGKE